MGFSIGNNSSFVSPEINCQDYVSNLSIINNSSDFKVIKKNYQSNLIGLAWEKLGKSTSNIALGLSGVTAGVIGVTLLHAVNTGMPNGTMLGLSITSLAASRFAPKFTGFCHSNAMYHFGPEFEIVRV